MSAVGGGTDSVCFVKTSTDNADISGTYKGNQFTGGIDIDTDMESGQETVWTVVEGDFDPSTATEIEDKLKAFGTEITRDAINNNKCLDL